MKILRQASFRKSPWKNGGGITHEVIRAPDADAFDWRLSVAQIDSSGPFSDFAGFTRTMVLLRGGGLSLRSPGQAERILRQTGDLTRFDGALAMHCELLQGSCVDLNLMVAKSLGDADTQLRLARQPFPIAGRGTRVLFSVQGRLSIQDSQNRVQVLDQWDAALSEPGDGPLLCGSADSDGPALVFVAHIPGRTSPGNSSG